MKGAPITIAVPAAYFVSFHPSVSPSEIYTHINSPY